MTALQAALLGIIQGLTEFLPISSSAHLILARAAFGWDAGEFGLAFDVACHVGTLGAVLLYFRRDLVAMVAAAPGALSSAPDEPALLVRHVAIGTVPVVVVGLLFADAITSTLRTPVVAAAALATGAFVMLAAERVGSRSRTEVTLSSAEAFGLGLAQAAALCLGFPVQARCWWSRSCMGCGETEPRGLPFCWGFRPSAARPDGRRWSCRGRAGPPA